MIKTTSSLHWLSRPLIFAFALMLLIGAGLPTPTRAQSDAETVWYWATTPEGLVAYTADGQVNQISIDLNFFQNEFYATRLAPDTAFLYQADTFMREADAFYLVTANDAKTIHVPSNIARQRPYGYHYPYLVLQETQLWLPSNVLNLATFEIISLAGDLADPPLFLPDGVTLLYVGRKFDDGHLISSGLFEQNLVSNEIKEVIRLADNGLILRSADATYWWLEDENGDIQTIGDPDPRYTEWLQTYEAGLYGNWIWQRDPSCITNCTLNGYSLVDDATFTVNLPDDMVYFPDMLKLLPDGSAVIVGWTDTPRMWLQEPDGTLVEMGVTGGMYPDEVISADGHWAVSIGYASEDDITFRLWDLTKYEIVYEVPKGELDRALFAGDTVVLYFEGQAHTLYWNDKTVSLDGYASIQYGFNFFQVFSGGHAFYEAPEGGIYRFDAETESMTLLVPEGRRILKGRRILINDLYD